MPGDGRLTELPIFGSGSHTGTPIIVYAHCTAQIRLESDKQVGRACRRRRLGTVCLLSTSVSTSLARRNSGGAYLVCIEFAELSTKYGPARLLIMEEACQRTSGSRRELKKRAESRAIRPWQ